MGPDTGRVSIPSWKLELIKNRQNSKTSASFSYYDRSRKPESHQMSTDQEDAPPAKPQDIIKFFNSNTATSIDVARVNVSRSRSVRERRGAAGVGTRVSPGGAGMWSVPGGEHCQPRLLSCERTDRVTGSVTVPVNSQTDRVTGSVSSNRQTDIQLSEDEDETELSDMIWPDTASSGVESDRYSDKGEVEILFGQSMHMGEDTRLFISNAGGRQEGDRQARLASGVGARLYRGRQVNKKNSGRGLNGNGSGDSDGMMGSGGESDSSEEIHYGPGFVSRLKSRYMSVALRGSPRGGLGTLRRTASLEYFLDCDKNCEEEEVELQPTHAIVTHSKPVSASTNSYNNQAKTNTMRESMKRAQSVEVLSFQSEKPPVLPSTFFSVDVGVSPPPSESPPPLPPRERDSPSVHGVLNTAPALVNDTIIIADKQPPPIPSSHPKPATHLGKTAAPLSNAASKPKMRSNNNSKTATQKQRNSTGVLFGVKDKELPAQDIVKETRKLFESAGARRTGSRAGGLTKSKSTSNLYSKSPSRSGSLEKVSKAGTKTSTRAGFSTSPQRRLSNSPARPKLPSKSHSSTPRPALPAKPSHLSPMVNGKSVSTVRSTIVDRHVQKVTPTKAVKSNYDKKSTGAFRPTGPSQSGTTGLVKASLANVIPSDTPSTEQDAKTRDLENKSIQLNLRPINSEKDTGKEADDKGTKRITSASIQNIRNSGNVVNFVFDDKSGGGKTHLPGSPESAKSSHPKQVGVIRPISRDLDATRRPGQDLNNHPDLKLKTDELKENKTSPIHVNKNNKVSGTKLNNDERKKETLIIEKDPVFVPVESWKENTQSKNYINKKIHSEDKKEAPLLTPRAPPVILTTSPAKAPPTVPPRNGSKLEHVEPVSQPRKYFDSNIEPLTSSPAPSPDLVKSDAKTVTADQDKPADVTDKSSSYRDSWKTRSDQQNNSFVFNFVNSKKDVSHIENDGLDLTKRSKKGGVILLDSNGESCDGDNSETVEEAEPVQCSNNFVFVGAEIKTGKSSIRSKLSKKKLNITFNDKTEVFEYPSFESVDMAHSTDINEREDQRDHQQSSKPQQSQSIFKNSSAVVGSSGGLGSYTPSKIQISESPFQLGVSRTTSSSSTPSTPSSSIYPSSNQSSKAPSSNQETILLPADDGVSWGSAASSDMLF